MASASTLTVPHEQEEKLSNAQPLSVAAAPEISPGAWKVIIWLGIGGVLFLAALAAYVFSGLYRYQNCL
jgi:hypothetical protein